MSTPMLNTKITHSQCQHPCWTLKSKITHNHCQQPCWTLKPPTWFARLPPPLQQSSGSWLCSAHQSQRQTRCCTGCWSLLDPGTASPQPSPCSEMTGNLQSVSHNLAHVILGHMCPLKAQLSIYLFFKLGGSTFLVNGMWDVPLKGVDRYIHASTWFKFESSADPHCAKCQTPVSLSVYIPV